MSSGSKSLDVASAMGKVLNVERIFSDTATTIGGCANFPEIAVRLFNTNPPVVAVALLYDAFVLWERDHKRFPAKMILAMTDFAVSRPESSDDDGRMAAIAGLLKLCFDYNLPFSLIRKIYLRVRTAVHSIPLEKEVPGREGTWHGNQELLSLYANYGHRASLNDREWKRIWEFCEAAGLPIPNELKED